MSWERFRRILGTSISVLASTELGYVLGLTPIEAPAGKVIVLCVIVLIGVIIGSWD